MSKPPKVVIPGMNRGAGMLPGFTIGRRRGKGRGPAELLDLTQMRGTGLELVSASNQKNSSAVSSGLSSVSSLSTSTSTVDSNQNTSLSQVSSSLSGAVSSTTSLSSAVSTVDASQSTSLSQISSSLSGASSSTTSLSSAVSSGYALLAAPNVFTAAPQTVQGTGGIKLQDTSASAGFSILERPSAPGHQVMFQSEAAVSAAGVTMHVFSNTATSANKSGAQIALWTISPLATNGVQAVVRAVTGASGEEMLLWTKLIGTGLTAGDIVFLPNNVERLRILAAAGDPAVEVTGQLAVTDDPYSASWDGSVDVPTKNAVYDKIETLGVWAPTVDGSSPPVFILDGSNQLIMTRIA